MKTFVVTVTQDIEVTLDETKFTEEFMQEYRDSFQPFHDLEEHAEHLAWLHATGREDLESAARTPFIEGYGPATDFSITVKVINTDVET